jgi:hypothetical protein
MNQDLESRLKTLEDRFAALVAFLGKTPYFNADVLQSAIDGPIAQEEDKLGKLM